MDDNKIRPYHKINGVYKRYGCPGYEDVPDDARRGDFAMGVWAVDELEYLQNNDWVWTEKLDGTNVRIGIDPDVGEIEFRGRTDRAILPAPLAAWLNSFVDEYDGHLFSAFPHGATLYCEGVGAKIQGGTAFGEQHCKLLDVSVGGWWLEKGAVASIAKSLGLDHAPVVAVCSINEAIATVAGVPKSAFGDFAAEGYVGQPEVRLFDAKHSRICAKVKVKDFVQD